MSDTIFLQEMQATVAFFDVKGFSHMSAQLGPVDLGIALRRYYEHVEEGIFRHEGKIIKFVSDGVLALFLAIGGKDHAGNALHALQGLARDVEGWLEENTRRNLPLLEYSAGMASGSVLYGELGTSRLRALDVLGHPVTLAVKLAHLATTRGTPRLIAASTVQAATDNVPCIEVEAAELGSKKVRLYRLLSPKEIGQEGA